jgi:hypothetical protein
MLNFCREQHRAMNKARHDTVKKRQMNDLVSLVMEAAATELLHLEAVQIDQEVQRLLAEMERAPVEELRRGGFAQRFLELLSAAEKSPEKCRSYSKRRSRRGQPPLSLSNGRKQTLAC